MEQSSDAATQRIPCKIGLVANNLEVRVKLVFSWPQEPSTETPLRWLCMSTTLFITCDGGAPEAEVLLKHGLVEGSTNVRAGQGTANRHFFFENFMLDLMWAPSGQ
jgi:hypothetical protein